MPSSGQPQAGGSPSPSAFAALNGSAPPPAKKVKLTFAEREAEKEMKRIQKEIKDQERAAEKARKEAERQAQVDDKARRDAEKEAEKKKKDAEREEKRLAQEAEKAAKEEKKRRKEEEKQKAEEEKRKEASKQKTLGSFFKLPAASTARRNSLGDRRSESPAPSNPSLLGTAVASPAASISTPKKPEKSAYEKTFPDFYIFPDVIMAPANRFERDEEASEALHCIIDSYILGNRSPDRQHQFNAASLFHLSGHDNVLRGKRCMPVREIMAEFSGKYTRPIDLMADSQNTQIKRTNDYLQKIPLKFLKFQEDVRPPYRGTYTSRPVNGIAKLARNPMRRDLPDTNYDYDSEAEWIEDEDAEDLNSEGDEDEELGEDGEDMEGFLDDENDEIANSKRLVLQGDLEPVSTGMCWEDHRKRNTNVKMMLYRMEIILGKTLPISQNSEDVNLHRSYDEIYRPFLNPILATSSSVNDEYGPTPCSPQCPEIQFPNRQRPLEFHQTCQALLHTRFRRSERPSCFIHTTSIHPNHPTPTNGIRASSECQAEETRPTSRHASFQTSDLGQ